MSEQLTEGEKAVLRALADHEGSVNAGELAGMLGQNDVRVVSILNSLSQKGLASLEIREIASYTLTQEGKEYSENGLPEVRLFRAVLELGGKARVDEAVARSGLAPSTKGIAINWSRKNGWLGITKEDGTTVLQVKTEDSETPVEEVLSAISQGREDIPESLNSALEEAIERSLVDTSMTKVFEAEVTRDKRNTIDELLSKDVKGIENLTSEMLSSESWRGKTFRPYNVELEPAYVNYGKKHPYAEFNEWLREIMIGLGFTEWFGPFVETEFWGHDTLFVPQDHVSREVQDQFRVVTPHDHGDILDNRYYRAVKAVHENGGETGSKGWDWPFSKEVATRLCLRPHTTPVSMRYLYEHRESPQKMFIIDRNFRSEKLDAIHGQEFDQCEGIIMDKNLTLRNLLGYLTSICKAIGIRKLKFKPGQYPFTEPSVETFGKHDKLGWIALGGSGIFRPEVIHPLGIKDTVLAWGLGSGRLYMAAMGINDIRNLLTRDLTWLRRSAFVS